MFMFNLLLVISCFMENCYFIFIENKLESCAQGFRLAVVCAVKKHGRVIVPGEPLERVWEGGTVSPASLSVITKNRRLERSVGR